MLGSGGVRGKEKGRVGRATTAGGVAGGEACRADLGSKGLNPERLFQVLKLWFQKNRSMKQPNQLHRKFGQAAASFQVIPSNKTLNEKNLIGK